MAGWPVVPRLLRFLLSLFPSHVRERDGRELEQTIRELWGMSAAKPVLARAVFRLRLTGDLVIGAAAEWYDLLWNHPSSRSDGEARGVVRFLDDLWRDIAYAARTLLRTSGFLVGTLSLALTIGATTAVYSTADWLLHRPMGGVVEPERLVNLLQYDDQRPDLGPFGFSFEQVHQFEAAQDGFSTWGAYGKLAEILSDDSGTDEIVFEHVTGNFFATLGARAALGRLIGPEDDRVGQPLIAVLSHRLWQSRYGGDPQVLGRSLRVNGRGAQIVGVLSEGFEDAQLDWNGPAEVWLPLDPAQENGLGVAVNGTFYHIVGRLEAGLTADLVEDRAQGWLGQLPQIKTQFYEINRVKVGSTTETRIRQRDEAGEFLNSLLIVCVLLMLAACFNTANIFLGRAAVRRRELALRSSLGASRARILKQLFTESLLVGACASAIGLAAGVGFGKLMAPLPQVYLTVPVQLASITTGAAVGPGLMWAAVGLGFATCLLFGLLPALIGARRAHAAVLKQPIPSWSWARFRLSLRQIAMALQVAFSVTLAITAGLYARSFARVASADPGYSHPDSLIIARLVLPVSRDDRLAFYPEFLRQVRARPEVVAASLGFPPPFAQAVFPLSSTEGTSAEVGFYSIFPEFFKAEGVSILMGREFEETEADPDVIVVNQELAQALWPGKDPMGQTLLYNNVEKRVIGVVRYPHCRSPIGEPLPCVWQPLSRTQSAAYTRIRVRRDGLALGLALRDIARGINPEVAVTQVATFDDIIAQNTGSQRAAAAISSILGVFCIMLLAIGAVTLFLSMVKDSLREIAIRMALGAPSARIMGRVMMQGLLLTTVGLVLGVLGARFISPYVADRLYQTEPTDVLTFTVIPLFVGLVGTAAVAYAGIMAVRTHPSEHLHVD